MSSIDHSGRHKTNDDKDQRSVARAQKVHAVAFHVIFAWLLAVALAGSLRKAWAIQEHISSLAQIQPSSSAKGDVVAHFVDQAFQAWRPTGGGGGNDDGASSGGLLAQLDEFGRIIDEDSAEGIELVILGMMSAARGRQAQRDNSSSSSDPSAWADEGALCEVESEPLSSGGPVERLCGIEMIFRDAIDLGDYVTNPQALTEAKIALSSYWESGAMLCS
ncbi:hypothetical protein CGRA01v4_15109 [Colletotrichum graminicola]|nr:hypothetical protein CGRA01v4_15109 [Colletotrichum graminicola]